MTDEHDNFDRFANEYDQTLAEALAFTGGDAAYYADRKIEALGKHYAQHALPAPMRVLEFGCGTGTNLPRLRNLFPQATLNGIDVSEKSIAIAQALDLERCDLRAYTGGALPYPDASFDLVIVINVLHHIQPALRPRVIKDIGRTLARGGLLAVFEHNPFNPLTRKVVRDCPFDEGVELLPPGETSRLMVSAGLTMMATRYIVFVPAGLASLGFLEGYLRHVPLGAQYGAFGRLADIS